MYIISLIILILSLQPVRAADPDLALLETEVQKQHNLMPKNHSYKEITEIISTAEKKWQNRVNLIKQQENSYRDRSLPLYTPTEEEAAKDQAAVKKELDYCQKQCASWEERTTNMSKIETRFKFYNSLIFCLDPPYKIAPAKDEWQQAAHVLNNQMQALFASFYRLIKQENSTEIYENSYLGVGWLKIICNSAYRKGERIINGKELLDQSNTFQQQLAIFDNFKNKIERNEKIESHYTSFSWLLSYIENSERYRVDQDKLRNFLAQIIIAADLEKK